MRKIYFIYILNLIAFYSQGLHYSLNMREHGDDTLKVKLVDWLVVLRIYVTLAVFQPYCELEAGDNQ